MHKISCLAKSLNSAAPFYPPSTSNNTLLESQNLKPAPTVEPIKIDTIKPDSINPDGVKSDLNGQIGGEQKKKRPLKLAKTATAFVPTSIATTSLASNSTTITAPTATTTTTTTSTTSTTATTPFVANTPILESGIPQPYAALHKPQKSPAKPKTGPTEKLASIIPITNENPQSIIPTPIENPQPVLSEDQIVPEILPTLEKKVSEKQEVTVTPPEIATKVPEIEQNTIEIIPEVKPESEIKVETAVIETPKSRVYSRQEIVDIVEKFRGVPLTELKLQELINREFKDEESRIPQCILIS